MRKKNDKTNWKIIVGQKQKKKNGATTLKEANLVQIWLWAKGPH